MSVQYTAGREKSGLPRFVCMRNLVRFAILVMEASLATVQAKTLYDHRVRKCRLTHGTTSTNFCVYIRHHSVLWIQLLPVSSSTVWGAFFNSFSTVLSVSFCTSWNIHWLNWVESDTVSHPMSQWCGLRWCDVNTTMDTLHHSHVLGRVLHFLLRIQNQTFTLVRTVTKDFSRNCLN